MDNSNGTFSTTQGTNLTVIAGAIVMLIAKAPNLIHPTTITADDLTSIIASAGIVIAAIISFVNRYKKGDVTPLGFKKY